MEQLRQTLFVRTLHKCLGVASWLDGTQCRLPNGHLLAIVWCGQVAMQPDDRHIVRAHLSSLLRVVKLAQDWYERTCSHVVSATL